MEHPVAGTIHTGGGGILDEFKVPSRTARRRIASSRNDPETMAILHRFTGAVVRRTIDPSRAVVAEHAHDWPMLSLYVMGGYRNVSACGEHDIAGPSFVFYGRGAAHRNDDRRRGIRAARNRIRSGLARRARTAARTGSAAHRRRVAERARGSWPPLAARAMDEEYLRGAVRELLASRRRQKHLPPGSDIVDAALRADPSRRIGELAGESASAPPGSARHTAAARDSRSRKPRRDCASNAPRGCCANPTTAWPPSRCTRAFVTRVT